MAERMFGMETEYGFAVLDEHGNPLPVDAMATQLLSLARARLPHLNDVGSNGVFIQNGSRLYVDAGYHPELAGCECTNPWDVVRYMLAGDRILSSLATALESTLPPGSQVLVFKANVDHGGKGVTWGSHESHLHRVDPLLLPPQLIPHLVSRVIYCGAGGFHNNSPGLQFLVSPRATHIEHVLSSNSTAARGIFHTKDEALSTKGHHRLHIICGESLSSHRATWLRLGTTSLVTAMAEAGLRPGDAVELASPLDALRAFAADPDLEALVPGVRKNDLSALDIQRHYLALAETHVDHPLMPPWAREACRAWREALEILENDPERARVTFDWAIKLSLFERHAERKGTSLAELALELALERGRPLLRLRQELFALDTRFGLLGQRGLFAQLEEKKLLEHEVPGVDNIEHAMAHPPSSGRARLRGEVIARLSGSGGSHLCDWQSVVDCKRNHMLDLSNPFETEERWREWAPSPRDPAQREHLLRGLLSVFEQRTSR